MKRILIGMLFWFGVSQAQTIPQVLQLQEPPLPVVTGLSVNYISGTSGVTTLYYWIVTRYVVGNSNLSAPVALNNITLGAGSVVGTWVAPTTNSNQAAWANPALPLTYDVLRTTSATFPSNGNCADCLVGTVNSSTFTDTLGALANYNTNTYVPGVYTLYIDNTSVLVNGTTPDLAINDGSKQIGIAPVQWANNGSNKNLRVNNNNSNGITSYVFMEGGVNKGISRYRGTGASPANSMDFGTLAAGGQTRLLSGAGLPALTCDPNQVCTFTNPCVGCGSGGSVAPIVLFDTSLATPPAPVVTALTTGATSASYAVKCVTSNGRVSSLSPYTAIANANSGTPNNQITMPNNDTNCVSYNVFNLIGNLYNGSNIMPGANLVDTIYPQADNVAPTLSPYLTSMQVETIQTSHLVLGNDVITTAQPLLDLNLFTMATTPIAFGIGFQVTHIPATELQYGLAMTTGVTESGIPDRNEITGISNNVFVGGNGVANAYGQIGFFSMSGPVNFPVALQLFPGVFNGGVVTGDFVGMDAQVISGDGGTISGLLESVVAGINSNQSFGLTAVATVCAFCVRSVFTGTALNLGLLLDGDGSITGDNGITGTGAYGLYITGATLPNLIKGTLEVDMGVSSNRLTGLSVLFASLATTFPTNGDSGYSSDSQPTNGTNDVCIGGGTGSWVTRLNGVYRCNQ